MITRRLRYWLGRARREASLREEIELHLDEKAAELRAEGWSEVDARVEARRRFGNAALKQDEAREIWVARYWTDFWHDVRYGARALLEQPGFAAAAVAALVLGVAVNSVLFSVFNSLALAPWAIRDARHAVEVMREIGPTDKGRWTGLSWPHYRYLRANTRTLAGLVAHSGTTARLRRGDLARDVSATTVSENYFDVIGTGFAAGRGFSPAGGNLHEPAPEIVLHYDTWIAQFGGDPAVVGEWLDISGHRLQVVGVAAQGFSGPTPTRPHLWIPAAWRDRFHGNRNTMDDPDNCCISVVGRLGPGVSREAALAEVSTLSDQFVASLKQKSRRMMLGTPSFFNPRVFGKASAVFLVMGVASLLILLLACANVANLQLARATARRREIAVRHSLGAGRLRIVRQLMAESLLLSAIAGMASLVIATWAPGWILRAVAPPGETLTFSFDVDFRVVAFVMLMTVASALLFGLAPAVTVVGAATAPGLNHGGRVTSSGRMRAVLLGAQVALCAILLTGTALLARAVDRVRHVDPGFQHEHLIVMSTGLAASGVSDEQARGLLATLVDRIEGLPQVESVTHAATIPFGDSVRTTSVQSTHTSERVTLGLNEVSASFFETLQIPLVAGRGFTRDDQARMDSAIVNEAAAERLWPGESPLGKTLLLARPAQVIGVVRGVVTRGIGSEAEPYAWVASGGDRAAYVMIRQSGDPRALLSALPAQARQIDHRYLASVTRYADVIARWQRSADVAAGIAGVLGLLALLLSCVGIYGVASYNVSQRTREVGVRMALGARPREIMALFARQHLQTVLVGAAIGTAGAIAFGHLLTALLYGYDRPIPWRLAPPSRSCWAPPPSPPGVQPVAPRASIRL